MSTPQRQNFVQIAYHVADLDEAIPRFARLMGIGPFLVRRHIPLKQVRYRGSASVLDISAAHAQAGPVQVELITQHCRNPSAFRDMYEPDEEGLHHVALFPEDYDAMIDHYHGQGHHITTELVTAEKRGAAYVDTNATLGHMVEVYRVNETLYDFYRAVAEAARDWDGITMKIEV
ncbi:VOC family protein [uncultured Erythrobacter sp.]|uniref:VOC family protein n=1 Tax=uncultured Erythrobacter sp. TaxID=263913 RepID=UPI002601F454|nr:VOC family protein [uncultured Erythrobacter sp.]